MLVLKFICIRKLFSLVVMVIFKLLLVIIEDIMVIFLICISCDFVFLLSIVIGVGLISILLELLLMIVFKFS